MATETQNTGTQAAVTNDPSQALHMLCRSNMELVEALMNMVDQFFYRSAADDNLLRHSFMSAEEGAIRALIDAGFAKEKDGDYELLWGKLSERWLEIDGKLLPATEGLR